MTLHPCQTDSVIYHQVLSLLRSALWGEERFPYSSPQEINWADVYKELRQQAVQFFPINLLARENPAQSLHYIAADAKNMMRWNKIMQEQQNLCHLLCDAGIPCAVVKGAAAARHYPKPSSRLFGDIDLLVSPANFDRACQLVSDGADYLGENPRHKEYKRNGIIVEIHQSFSTLSDSRARDLFDKRIFDAINAAESVTTESYTFFCLPKIEHGLTLLEHIDIHLENGLGLRQIIDWMMFVNQELTDDVWQAEFAPFLRQLNREKLAVTVTRMCQMYLGLRTDGITWCANADEALCHELLEFILHQGNFGRKNPHGSNRAAAVIGVSKNPISLFRVLQETGCKNWELLDRYPFLKPFAWLHQIIRYIRKGLCTEHPFQFLKNAIKKSKSQSRFLDSLGVTQIAENSKKRQN